MGLIFPVQAANSVPKVLNYQARVTDSGGVPVPNGALSVIFRLYDGSGTCLYSARGTCGAPTAKSVTVTNSVFSTQLGEAGDNEIPDGLFDNNVVTLGITIGADAEMTPRKRLTAAAYAFNADRLDDLDVTSSGSTTAYIPSTTVNGNLVITGDPQGPSVGNGSLYINPANAAASETLFGIADGGSTRFQIDKEGDVLHTGSLLATAASSTAQFIYRGAASPSVNLFEVQNTITDRLFSVSATGVAIMTASPNAILDIRQATANTGRLFWAGPAYATFSADVRTDYFDIANSVFGYHNNLEASNGVYNGLTVMAENNVTTQNSGFQAFTAHAISSHASGNKATMVSGFFQSYHTGAGTLTSMTDIAVYPRSKIGSGTIADATGIFVSPSLEGTTTDLVRIWIAEGDSTGVTTNSYGLYIEELEGNGDVLNYAIYSDTPNFPFALEAGGYVGIGTGFPSAPLTVARGAAPTANLFEITNALAAGTYTSKYFTVSSTSTLVNPSSLNGYKLGVGNAAPANLFTVGSATSTFEIDATGNIRKINNVIYSWPASQGGASTVLQNNGSGTLSWTLTSALTNLNQAYLASTSTAEISLTPSIGAVTIQDTLSGTGNIFEIVDRTTAAGDWSRRYFSSSATNTQIGSASNTHIITPNARFAGNLTPSVDNTYTLGDPALRWKDLWLSGGSANIAYDTSGTSILRLGWTDTNGRRAIVHSSGQPLQITPNLGDTNGLFVAANGYVGVGTTNPSGRLEVFGDVLVPATDGVQTGELVIRNDGSLIANARQNITNKILRNDGVIHLIRNLVWDDGVDQAWEIEQGTDTGALIEVGQEGISLWMSPSGAAGTDSLALQLMAKEVGEVVIPTQLGVGYAYTDSVARPLEVKGTDSEIVKIFRNSSLTNVAPTGIRMVQVTDGTIADEFGMVMQFGIDSGAIAETVIAEIGGVRSGNNSSGAIVFNTYNTGVGTEKARILPNGNFGIGNTAPAQRLAVGSATSTFEVDPSGNLVKINNVVYSWPASQGAASTVLQNNGSGVLSWAAAAGSNLNQAYLSSTGSPEIALTPSVGAVTIADTLSGTGNIFEITDRTTAAGDFSRRYFTVSSTSTNMAYDNLTSSTAFGVSSSAAFSGNLMALNGSANFTGDLLEMTSAATFGRGIFIDYDAGNNNGTIIEIMSDETSVSGTAADTQKFAVTAAGSISGDGSLTIGGSTTLGDSTGTDTLVFTSGATTGSLALFQTSGSVSTGNVLRATSTNNTMTTGRMFSTEHTAPNVTSAFTGFLNNLESTRTFSSAGTYGESGSVARIQRSLTSSGAGVTVNSSGDVLLVNSDGTQTSGTLNITGNVLELAQNYAAASGAALNIVNAGTGADIALPSSAIIDIGDGGTLIFRDGTNTLCTVTDAGTTGNFSCTGSISGGGSNLNQAYLSSTSSAEISLTPSIGAVTIADTFSGTGNIFEVQNRTNAAGDYSVRYLTVSATSTRFGNEAHFLPSVTGDPQIAFVGDEDTGIANTNGGRFDLISDGTTIAIVDTNFTVVGAAELTVNGGVIDLGAATSFLAPGPTTLTFASNATSLFIGDAQGLTTIENRLLVHGEPQGPGIASSALYVNPITPSANESIFAVANNGGSRFKIDAEGDIDVTGSLLALSASSTSQFLFRGATGAGVNVFEVQDSFTNRLLSVSSTSTRYINRLIAPAHAVNQGLQLPTNAGVPAAVTGTAEGDIVWNSTGNTLYVYDGAAFAAIGATTNLNQGYLAATGTTEIYVNSTQGGLTIADQVTGGFGKGRGIGNIFEVTDRTNTAGDWSQRYFTVSATTVSIGPGDGNNGSPALSFIGDQDTGFWQNVDGAIAMMSNGSTVLIVEPTGNVTQFGGGSLINNGGVIDFGSSTAGLADSPTTLTFASAATSLTIGATGAGTTTVRTSLAVGNASGTDVLNTTGSRVTGNLTPSTDNTYSLGDYNRRWKDLWLSGGSAHIAYDTSGTTSLDIGWVNRFAHPTDSLRARLFSSGKPIQITPNNGETAGLYIDTAGRVGMGTTLPTIKLHVEDNVADFVAYFDNNGSADTRVGIIIEGCADTNPTSSCELISFREGDGGGIGRVRGNGAGGVTYATTGAGDFGERLPGDPSTLPDGYLVAVGEAGTALKATKGADLIGVVNDNIVFAGNDGLDPVVSVPVAMLGLADAFVNVENGAIQSGDLITLSSTPGVGMKSIKPGMIVGRAMQDWSGPGQGKIQLYVSPQWHSGLTITTDGASSLFADDFAFKPLDVSSASGTSFSSYALKFGGSAWDSASNSAVTRNISVRNNVIDPDTYQLEFQNNVGGTLASLNQNGDLALAGSLTVNGGFDYAETFPATPDLDAGDIVMVDATNANGYGVKKSDKKYENTLLGVISTKPGFLTGKSSASTQPVALAGRVPVKVNTESGEIKPGDPITSSSTPGVGMKAAEAGRVIGIALEGWNEDGTGTITVFVNPSWWNGPAALAGTTAGGPLTAGGETLIDLKNSTLANVSAIVSSSGLWSVTADGVLAAQKVEAKSVQAENVVLVQSEEAASVSEGMVPSGYNATVVHNPSMTSNAKVFVSFLGDPGGGYWIGEKGEGDFTLHLAKPATQDLPFEYWILGVDDRRPSPPIGTDESTPPSSGSPPIDPETTGSASGTDETEPTPTGADPAPTEPPVTESGTSTNE